MKHIILIGQAMLGVVAAEESGTGKNITITADTPWTAVADEPEAIPRALADVQRDGYI
ncbi:MAG: hypothetical protein NTW21_39235 [Verrucomicrobia bacterium]|nr:hypothetical protein [Verrucomicrobiota bacterium]